MSCTYGFVLQSDWYHQVRHWKSKTLPADVTRLSPPPVLRRELGNEASIVTSGTDIVVLCCPSQHTDTMLYSQLAGQQLSDNNLPVVMEELNKACVKWYNIGMMLRVSLDRLDTIKEQYSNPSDCLRETLKIWLKTYPSHPTWSNIVDTLRSYTVGEIKLATDLERKYCLTQDTSVAATYHPVSVTAVSASHMTTLPQFMAPLSQPPVFVPPYSMPPQPHPSHLPPWSAQYYSLPPTSQPVSAQLLPPIPARTAHTATPPTMSSQVTPDPTLVPSSYLPTPVTTSPAYPVIPFPPPSLPHL